MNVWLRTLKLEIVVLHNRDSFVWLNGNQDVMGSKQNKVFSSMMLTIEFDYLKRRLFSQNERDTCSYLICFGYNWLWFVVGYLHIPTTYIVVVVFYIAGMLMVRYPLFYKYQSHKLFFWNTDPQAGCKIPKIDVPFTAPHGKLHNVNLARTSTSTTMLWKKGVVRSQIFAQFWASLHPGFCANRRHQRDRELHAQRSALECMAPWLKSRMRRFTSNWNKWSKWVGGGPSPNHIIYLRRTKCVFLELFREICVMVDSWSQIKCCLMTRVPRHKKG